MPLRIGILTTRVACFRHERGLPLALRSEHESVASRFPNLYSKRVVRQSVRRHPANILNIRVVHLYPRVLLGHVWAEWHRQLPFVGLSCLCVSGGRSL